MTVTFGACIDEYVTVVIGLLPAYLPYILLVCLCFRSVVAMLQSWCFSVFFSDSQCK